MTRSLSLSLSRARALDTRLKEARERFTLPLRGFLGPAIHEFPCTVSRESHARKRGVAADAVTSPTPGAVAVVQGQRGREGEVPRADLKRHRASILLNFSEMRKQWG